MGETRHTFPPAQAEYLRAWRDGRYHSADLSRRLPSSVSLVAFMPPVYRQALQGTCVASAVTALLEYYGDCKNRLSVQYLYAVTKDIEYKGLMRNLEALRTGAPLDPGFEAVYHNELLQLRLLADANGGMDASVVKPYRIRFEDEVKARFGRMPGCLLMSCFHAVETRGVCRYALWPYAASRTVSVFGETVSAALEVPPGADEDAAKRRMAHGLYLLATPNNVDEVRAILAGVNGRRAMPVVVTVDFFEGCDGETYALPGSEEAEDGRLVSTNAWRGRHGLLIVGYEDSSDAPGGGWFLVRNSLGEDWGAKGYGRLPYAYLECFAVEAGTILQDMVDYVGDGYDGQRKVAATVASAAGRRRRIWMLNGGVALALVALTIAVGVYFDDPLRLRPRAPDVPPVAGPADAHSRVKALSPRPLPPDAGMARDCHIVVRGQTGESVGALLGKLLPDVSIQQNRDAWGEEFTLRASIKRMRLLALSLQAFLKTDVFQLDHGARIEILGADAPEELVIASDDLAKVKAVLAGDALVRNVKVLSEKDDELTALVIDRAALRRVLEGAFGSCREDEDYLTVRNRADGASAPLANMNTNEEKSK